MGEFNNRHLDLITNSSIYVAKTILDLYTDNINKNLRIAYLLFCYLKSLKIKQNKMILTVETNINIDKNTNLKVSLLVKYVIFTITSKGVKNVRMSSDY